MTRARSLTLIMLLVASQWAMAVAVARPYAMPVLPFGLLSGFLTGVAVTVLAGALPKKGAAK